MFQLKAKIEENKEIAKEHYKLTLLAESIAKEAKPGQFIQIKIDSEVFLRRPFSIHRVRCPMSDVRCPVEIIYKVIGKGTKVLSRRKKGEELDIIGPLGNGFDLLTFNSQLSTFNSILVGGGYGVSPLYFLAERMVKNSNKSLKTNIYVLIGAKTKDYILCEDDFKKLGCKVYIATEDGSKGYKGLVANLLNFKLPTLNFQLPTLYVCGPYPMLKEVAKIARKYKIKCYVSLEEVLACGFGACLGCTVKTKDGYKLVCKDGPVFDAQEIRWK